MSSKDSCWNNALQECFSSTLKLQLDSDDDRLGLSSAYQLQRDLASLIEGYYDCNSCFSTIGNISPIGLQLRRAMASTIIARPPHSSPRSGVNRYVLALPDRIGTCLDIALDHPGVHLGPGTGLTSEYFLDGPCPPVLVDPEGSQLFGECDR